MSPRRAVVTSAAVCLLIVALCASPVVTAQAGTPTGTTAGGDGGGLGIVFVLLVMPAVLGYLAVTYGFIRLADRQAADPDD